MKLLLRLYPGWWRRRYGAEALDILESRPVTPSVLWNVVIGAVDAWLNQGVPPTSAGDTNQRESGGGYLMTGNRKRNKRAASVLALSVSWSLSGSSSSSRPTARSKGIKTEPLAPSMRWSGPRWSYWGSLQQEWAFGSS